MFFITNEMIDSALPARRAFAALIRKNSDALIEESLASQDDDEFGFSSFDDEGFVNAFLPTSERILIAVADRFGFTPEQLDNAITRWDEDEAEFREPPCPFEDRGLDCRNSAPVGIDADGEPYGSRGCGCDKDRLRSKTRIGRRVAARPAQYDAETSFYIRQRA